MSDYLPIEKSNTASDFDLKKRITIREADNKETLYDILTDGTNYPTISTRTNFDGTFGSGEATIGAIYKEDTYRETGENNNKDVYYFAGNVADNWVKFAGFYWRIIRTNEDGSIRLLYAGSSPDTTEGYITRSQSYNRTTTNTMYVGWMYGTIGSIGNNRGYTNSAPIKITTENWYRDNIANNANYDNLVSTDAIYCNDRASGLYAANEEMYYALWSRSSGLAANGRQPSYQCGQNSVGGYTAEESGKWVNSTDPYTSSPPSIADKFSKTTGSGGNGQLTYPVGLITADEIMFAGGRVVSNSRNAYYYLNSAGGSVTGSKYWWTMTPAYFDVTISVMNNRFLYMYYVRGSGSPGYLTSAKVSTLYTIRPVISLKPEVEVSQGSGTADDPFIPILP